MGLMLVGHAVAVVEDEGLIRERIAHVLTQAGYQVTALAGRRWLFELVQSEACSAIVLDLGLPEDDGLAITREIRQFSQIPILMLTGRGGIRERVAGLEAGADDYLVKPFAPEELVARLRVMLRRVRPPPGQGVPVAIDLGDARLDLRTRVLSGRSGEQRLTEREARIIQLLAQARGPLSRATLSRDALDRVWEPQDKSLDVHLSNLRRKLQLASGERGMLVTIRSLGFELRVASRVVTEG